jgi:hypothetical protein
MTLVLLISVAPISRWQVVRNGPALIGLLLGQNIMTTQRISYWTFQWLKELQTIEWADSSVLWF